MQKNNTGLSYNERLVQAADMYLERKKRISHPDGYFDKAGRWYQSEEETCIYCSSIRPPSNAYKYSLMLHCRTCDHLANLYGVSSLDIKRYISKEVLPPVEEGEYYKEVAAVNGKLYSIFDGTIEYQIGITLSQDALPGHKGGFYVYKSMDEANDVSVPKASKLKDEPRVLLRLYCTGDYCKYNNGKLSFSQVTPIEIVNRAK